MNKKTILLVILVIVFLTGCGSIATALDYVPESDLEAVQDQVSDLEDQIEELEDEIADLEAVKTALTAELDELRVDLDDKEVEISGLTMGIVEREDELAAWRILRCSDHTWEEVLKVYGNFPFKNATDVEKFGKYVFFTQWKLEPGWVNGEYSTTLLQDTDGIPSLIIDTEQDCVIINPKFSDVGN